MDSNVKKVIAKVLKANPTLEEIETNMSRHSMFDKIYAAAEEKLDRFKQEQENDAMDDLSKFQPDNRDLFARNFEYGFWNRDQLEIAESVALKTYGEGFMGEANMDDSSNTARMTRELLTVSKGGSVCMAPHDNVGRVSRANMIRKSLGIDYQQATELEMFWKKLELSPAQGIKMIKSGTEFNGVLKKFSGTQQAWEYFNTLACELDAITPEKLKIGAPKDSEPPAVAYHLMGADNAPKWKPKKRLRTLLNRIKSSDYGQLKALGSEMVKYRFPTWQEGSVFWAEYKKAKREKNPFPYHTKFGLMLIARVRKGLTDPINHGFKISKVRAMLFKHGKKGTGRLNELDLNVLWKLIKAIPKNVVEIPLGSYDPNDYPEMVEN
jgi:hypothetical protein